MIALLLAFAGQAASTPLVKASPEIVIIGRRLAALSVNVGHDARGRFNCSLSQSSGNSGLDARLCGTAATCVKKGAADEAAISACIDRRKPALLKDLGHMLSARRAR